MTNFGDNVQDEWFIVFLLFQLTKFDDTLVITVEDNDGDFLLIEAAHHLPKWLEPDTSENRTFLYQGAFHLIPLDQQLFPLDATPTIFDAINFIREHADRTKCNEKIQNAINDRIKGYPNRVKELHHKANCYVPNSVAALLQSDSSLVSYAVRSFYLRDPIDLKACRAMKYFPPENRVMRTVTFTRCLYAQLVCQSFKPDAKTGWNMPPENSNLFKSHDLGMKLACGFEILVSNCSNNNNNSKVLSNSFDNSSWEKFDNSLKANGYFGNELVGSKNYNALLENAKCYFHQIQTNDDHKCVPIMKKIGLKILDFLKSEHLNDLKDEILGKEDDDSWLNCNTDELDNYLSEKFSLQKQSNLSESELASTITTSLSAFVEKESGIKGVKPKNFNSNQVDFDPETFANALESVLSLNIPQSDSDESSAMSDYSYSDELDSDDQSEDELSYNKTLNDKKAKDKIEEMKLYMKEMDKELAETKVGQSFERKKSAPLAQVEDDGVDINLTTLTNILQSYKNEQGVPGPTSTLFSSMGIQLPENSEN